jgi:hypothetical protein
MADDYKITITFELDPGNVESEAGAAGREAGDAFGKGFKPQINLDDIFSKQTGGYKQTLAGFGEQFKKLDLGKSFERQLADVDVEKSFGARLEKTVRESHQRGMEAAAATARAAAPAEDFKAMQERISSRVMPIIGGLEAFTQLMRGAPLAHVAETALRPFIETARREREGPRAPPGGLVPLPTGEPPAAGTRERAEMEWAAATRRPTSGVPIIPLGIGVEAGAAEGGIGAALRGMLTRGVLGGTAGSFVGAGAGGAIGGALGGPAGAVAGIALQKAIEAVAELGTKLEEMGEHGARANLRMHEMAATLGTTPKALLETGAEAAHLGVNFDALAPMLERLAITARMRMPAIMREVKDADNVIEEANIKVRDSHRAVEKAVDDRAAATAHVTKAEAELAKQEITGADVRAQQAQEAELRVAGAQTALEGARMRAREAQIQQIAAPQRAAIEAVQGPETVEGARLGARGAQIAAEEARARYRRFQYGEEEDEDTKQRRRERQERLRLDTAEHNLRQAQINERKATLDEQVRQAREAAGLGPEAQAAQRAAEAAQAEKTAKLNVQRAETSRTRLRIDQAAVPLEEEHAELIRNRNEAERQRQAAEEKRAEIQEKREKAEQERLQYRLPTEVLRGIRGEIPGYEAGRIEPGALREAITFGGRGRVLEKGGMLDLMSQFLRGPLAGAPTAEMDARIRELFGGMRGFRYGEGEGGGGVTGLRKLLLQSPEEQERFWREHPEQRERVERGGRELERYREPSEAFVGQKATEAFNQRVDEMIAGMKAEAVASAISGLGNAITSGATEVKGAFAEAASIIVQGAQAAAKSGMAAPPSEAMPAPAAPAGGTTEAVEQQLGGLIHGPGSETSDSIPINASRGEYVVRASAVRQIGVPFLNALNEGRIGYQAGGAVPEIDWRKVFAATHGGMSPEEWARSVQEALNRPKDSGLTPVEVSQLRSRLAAVRAAAAAAPAGGGAVARGEIKRGPAVRPGIAIRGTFASQGQPRLGERFQDVIERLQKTRDTGGASLLPGQRAVQQFFKQHPELRDRVKFAPSVPEVEHEVAPVPSPQDTDLSPETVELRRKIAAGELVDPLDKPATTRAGVDARLKAGKEVTDAEWNTWMKPSGPKIGGWEPILPPSHWVGPKGTGDYDIERGGRGDQTYFGKGDYAIPSSRYGYDVERPPREPAPPREPPPPPQPQRKEPESKPEEEGFQQGGEVQLPSDLTPAQQVFERSRPELGESASGRAIPTPSDETMLSLLSGGRKALSVFGSMLGGRMQPIDLSMKDRKSEGEGFQGGGSIGGLLSADGFLSKAVLNFANGGLIGDVADAMNAPHYADGGLIQAPLGRAGAEGYHQLDLRTNAGTFGVQASADTIDAIRSSAISSKLSATGFRPSWYS